MTTFVVVKQLGGLGTQFAYVVNSTSKRAACKLIRDFKVIQGATWAYNQKNWTAPTPRATKKILAGAQNEWARIEEIGATLSPDQFVAYGG